MTSIHIQNVSLAYGKNNLFTQLNMELPAGKWTGLLGPSGVGKSSLLRLIAGLTTVQEMAGGRIHADNELPVSEQVAYMAQTDLLLPWLTVLGNAMLGSKMRYATRTHLAEQKEKAELLLEKAGLNKARDLYPHQLSGGMRQRVALVRTLMENKPLVLMDEPFSALDAITRYKLQALAAELLHEKTVLFITHDPFEALRLAHDIYIMQGSPAVLKPIANLTSPIPRELKEAELLSLQSMLFSELTQASETL